MRIAVLGPFAAALLLAVAWPAAAQVPKPAATEPSPTQAEFIIKGQAIVAERCARCHATAMLDKSPHDKAPPFRDVVERYPSENLAEALAEGIVSGHKDMPVFVFNPPEIEAFLAYLDSLERPKGK